MYSGNSGSSNNMLYGGPLGTYLSGIYQPITSINHNAPKVNRRSSLRTGVGANSPSSSLYLTPQPRRRHENTDRYISPTPSVTSTYTEPMSSRLRPKSYYNSNPSNSVSGGYNRPSSMVFKNNLPPRVPSCISNNQENILDYKKLYEEEKLNNDQIRKEIMEIEKELKLNNNIIESKKRSSDKEKALTESNVKHDTDKQEFELLKNEGDKLRAENRALARVVARLSREK